jgi:glycoside hydrolase-like protein/VCBS repeat protein/WD40 repeat protein
MINNEQLVSSDALGAEGNNNSFDPSISADGSKVAFVSWAYNLVNGSPSFIPEIYIKNLTTRAVALVSQTNLGTIANDTCLQPAISADGNSVVFQSVATNLGSTSGITEIYVKNLQTQALTLVSSSSAKVAANGNSSQSAISKNGNMVAFQSGAYNLVTNVSGSQVYIKNVQSGAVALVSRTANGTVGNDLSKSPTISDDGTKVAFTSDSTNLVAGATVGNDEIYLKDTSTPTGAVILVSQTKSGVIANASNEMPSISADGNTIAFQSTATNLAAGTSGLLNQIYVKNVQTHELTLASETADGTIANGDCGKESLSADGRYVVFRSFATNLVAGVSGPQLYLKDLKTGALSLLSANAAGAQGSNDSDAERAGSGRLISGDDATFVFDSDATNLLFTGSTDHEQVFANTLGGAQTIAGFDIRAYPGDAVMAWLKANTNLGWVGYYLYPTPSHNVTSNGGDSWMATEPNGSTVRATLASQGWLVAPIYVGEQDPAQVAQDRKNSSDPSGAYNSPTLGNISKGTADGNSDETNSIGLPNSAVPLLRQEGFARGTTIYLDIETGGAQSQAELQYIKDWCSAVSSGGYNPGIYCSASAYASIATVESNVPFWIAKLNFNLNTTTPPFPSPDPSGSGVATATAWQYLQNYSITGIPTSIIPSGQLTVDLDSVRVTNSVTGSFARNDFNNDGNSDILLQNIDGATQMWLMNGISAASTASLGNPGAAWHAAATGDFNRDGKADIVLQNNDGLPQVWLMNGASVTSTATLLNPGPSWHTVATGDFNADGNTDILWQNTDGRPAIWEMNGSSIASFSGLLNPGPSWHVIGAGDFNNDGKTDILWQNTDGRPAIWEMNGLSIASFSGLLNPGPSWHAIGGGDFNNSGDADILWQNTDGRPAIWEMNGLSIASFSGLTNPGPSWHAIGTSDFNGDGNADIIWQNADGMPAIWAMNGLSILTFGGLPNPGTSWQIKDDGPIPADQMGNAPANGALHLSAPDLLAGGATSALGDQTTPLESGRFLPLIGQPTFGT